MNDLHALPFLHVTHLVIGPLKQPLCCTEEIGYLSRLGMPQASVCSFAQKSCARSKFDRQRPRARSCEQFGASQEGRNTRRRFCDNCQIDRETQARGEEAAASQETVRLVRYLHVMDDNHSRSA